MPITKCQGQAILLHYKRNSLYTSSLHVIKSLGLKINFAVSVNSLELFAITMFYRSLRLSYFVIHL